MRDVQAVPKTALVVDDGPVTRDRLRRLLEEEGVQAFACRAESREVYRRFVEVDPDCVVIDVTSQRLGSFGLLAAMRSWKSRFLLVVLTNENAPELERESLAAGADYYLSKSRDFERVASLVRGLQEGA